jgi:hypothetical protein
MTEPRAACSVETSAHLRETIKTLGPWFHNLQVKHIPTAPDHFLGDFPRIRWARFAATIPDDPTNWWLPNVACAEAMLRSTGLEILSRPEEETWWCAPTATRRNGRFLQEAELRGEVWQ